MGSFISSIVCGCHEGFK